MSGIEQRGVKASSLRYDAQNHGNMVIHGRHTAASVETSLTLNFQSVEGLRTLACKQQGEACTRPEPGKLVAHIRRGIGHARIVNCAVVPAASKQHVAVYGIRDSHWIPREPRRHREYGRP